MVKKLSLKIKFKNLSLKICNLITGNLGGEEDCAECGGFSLRLCRQENLGSRTKPTNFFNLLKIKRLSFILLSLFYFTSYV